MEVDSYMANITVGGYQAAYFYDYHPWHRGYNPHFDKNSSLILDLKQQKGDAVAHFVELVCSVRINGEGKVAVCIVPSSNPENTESGIRLVAVSLAKKKRLTNATACLKRISRIEKAAHGGPRSLQVHLESIQVTKPSLIRGARVLLLDDVMTTGNSLIACAKLLEAAGAIKVAFLIMGRTV